LNELADVWRAAGDLSAAYSPCHRHRPEVTRKDAAIENKKPTKKPRAKKPPDAKAAPTLKTLDLDEIRVEFGIDEADGAVDDSDYENALPNGYCLSGNGPDGRCHQGISGRYQSDRSQRYKPQILLLCQSLGHCFMQKGMAKLALKWFNRALEVPDLTADEKKGIWYELGEAHEVDGDHDNAARYFEQVYAEDVDFRDVGNRLQNLAVNA
jgi:tetratricopeptide (TPR) repeat protein